tara:strand:+ start:138 stop:1238 length:1101 start_codon:yes stop_codon:yes gene_type:complete
MSRVLKRPMFRIGGSTGTGITSGLDAPRKKFEDGTDPYDRAFKTTTRAMEDLQKFRGEKSAFMPGALPGFLTQFGLNLLSQTPTGNVFQTAATAAKEPFKTFQAAQLAEREDERKRAEDLFSGALASEYDLEAQRIKSSGDSDDNRKTAEVEMDIITGAQNKIFEQRDILANEDSTDAERLAAERVIKVQQNVLVKELGVPAEYAAIISVPELFDAEMTTVVNTYNLAQEKKRNEYAKNNPDVDLEEVVKMFPSVLDGSAEARAMTFADLKERFYYNKGGRAGFKLGTEDRMMESVAESKRQTGEVKDLTYTELRARLPQEISNDIVQLLANSKQALLDFANIQTGEDISLFNKQYDVNLTLPQGA